MRLNPRIRRRTQTHHIGTVREPRANPTPNPHPAISCLSLLIPHGRSTVRATAPASMSANASFTSANGRTFVINSSSFSLPCW